jgi:hypothetical protein
MTEACESMEQLETFNTNMSLPPINLEDTYDFASLLFSPPQQSVEPTEYLRVNPFFLQIFEYNRNRFKNVKNEGSGLRSIGRAKIKEEI